MKNIWKIVLVAFFFLFIWLSDTKAQDERQLSSFSAVTAMGNIEVILQQGDDETATVSAQNMSEDDVSVFVKKGVLKIQLLNSIFYKDEEVKVYVTFKEISYLKASAGAQVKSNAPIEVNELTVKAASGARVNLNVRLNSLDATAIEGGILTIMGSTEKQSASAATGAEYNGASLDCKSTIVKANTGGVAEVNAFQSLDASAHTGGKIIYAGNPGERSTKTRMSGSIRKNSDS